MQAQAAGCRPGRPGHSQLWGPSQREAHAPDIRHDAASYSHHRLHVYSIAISHGMRDGAKNLHKYSSSSEIMSSSYLVVVVSLELLLLVYLGTSLANLHN